MPLGCAIRTERDWWNDVTKEQYDKYIAKEERGDPPHLDGTWAQFWVKRAEASQQLRDLGPIRYAIQQRRKRGLPDISELKKYESDSVPKSQ